MTDIVERLRDCGTELARREWNTSDELALLALLRDAADEIERLRTQVAIYHSERQQLRSVAPESCDENSDKSLYDCLCAEIERLRAEVQHLVAVNGEIDASVCLARKERDEVRAACWEMFQDCSSVRLQQKWAKKWPWIGENNG